GVQADRGTASQVLAAARQLVVPGDDYFADLPRLLRRRRHVLKHRYLTVRVFQRNTANRYPSLTHQPASTGRTAPVISRASSLHRNTAASEQSSGRPGPPASGCFVRRYAWMAGSPTARAAIGVSISPGASTLNRMPSGA